jgi:hypothetical protein
MFNRLLVSYTHAKDVEKAQGTPANGVISDRIHLHCERTGAEMVIVLDHNHNQSITLVPSFERSLIRNLLNKVPLPVRIRE